MWSLSLKETLEYYWVHKALNDPLYKARWYTYDTPPPTPLPTQNYDDRSLFK